MHLGVWSQVFQSLNTISCNAVSDLAIGTGDNVFCSNYFHIRRSRKINHHIKLMLSPRFNAIFFRCTFFCPQLLLYLNSRTNRIFQLRSRSERNKSTNLGRIFNFQLNKFHSSRKVEPNNTWRENEIFGQKKTR